MNMEKYKMIMEDFSESNCSVDANDIIRRVNYKKRSWKKWAFAVTCVILIFAGTSSAAAGLFDLKGLFKKIFKDEVTRELIEEGAIYEVNLTSQNEKYTITFEGITGDSDIQYGVFKIVDHTGELGNPKFLELCYTLIGTSVVEAGRLSEYGYRTNMVNFTTLDGEDNTYYIEVELPSYWTYVSDEDLYISIKELNVYYADLDKYPKIVQKPLKVPLEFEHTLTLDRSVFPKAKEITIEETLTSEFGSLTLKHLEVSRYNARLFVSYPDNENIITERDAIALWHRIDNDINSEGEFKLFVDGNEILRKVKTGIHGVASFDESKNPPEWWMSIEFETFDVDTAQTIEVKYQDQTIKLK